MKILNIIEEIAEITPENVQGMTRDEAIKNMGNWGKKLAMAALPTSLLLLGFQQKARAGTAPSNSAIGAVLNFALTLEYLESTFYTLAISANSGGNVVQTSASGTNSTYQGTQNFIGSSSDLAVFQQIQKHEAAHVTLLLGALQSLAITPATKPDFDFTGGNSLTHAGPFSPFTNYQDFLTLSQAFEDTGVRAYKGQAGNLQFSTTLTTALQIHSVEARHASEVRRIRGEKGWITSTNTTLTPTALFSPVYAGDDNLTQGGVNVYSNSQALGVSMNAATEAFDEPLDMNSVLAIANAVIIH